MKAWAIVVCVGILTLIAGSAMSQSISSSGIGAVSPGAIDCSKVEINYEDDPSLTREEKVALMDRALLRSLSKYDECKSQQKSASAASNNSGSTGSAGGASGGDSVASSDMSGTEVTAPATPFDSSESELANTGTQLESVQSSDNGKIPEDIPPADNDSILEAQIRQAAMNEKDPEIREKLWDEYRKYKMSSKVE